VSLQTLAAYVGSKQGWSPNLTQLSGISFRDAKVKHVLAYDVSLTVLPYSFPVSCVSADTRCVRGLEARVESQSDAAVGDQLWRCEGQARVLAYDVSLTVRGKRKEFTFTEEVTPWSYLVPALPLPSPEQSLPSTIVNTLTGTFPALPFTLRGSQWFRHSTGLRGREWLGGNVEERGGAGTGSGGRHEEPQGAAAQGRRPCPSPFVLEGPLELWIEGVTQLRLAMPVRAISTLSNHLVSLLTLCFGICLVALTVNTSRKLVSHLARSMLTLPLWVSSASCAA